MKALLSLGIFNKNILFPVIGGIISFTSNIIVDKSKFSDCLIVLYLGSSFGMTLSFILVIIHNHINKINGISFDKIYQKEKKEKFIHRIKYVLLCASLDFIETCLIYKYCLNVKVSLWIFDIIFLSLFSYIILKIKIYKHHYLSIIVIIVTGIIVDIIIGHYNNISDIKNILFKLLTEIMISLDVVVTKYTMENKYYSPYEMCFYAGIFEFILYSLLLLLSYHLKFLDNFKADMKIFELKDICIFIILIILLFIYNLFNYITVKKTSTFHILIIIILGELAPYILEIIDNKYKSYKIITIILGLFLILFMTLIFNEIIELNFLGLEEYTKKNIYIRSKLDEKGEDDNESRCSEGNYTFNLEEEDTPKLKITEENFYSIPLKEFNKE